MSADAPPFRRILIANRGEIAVRIIRTCREMGIESVAVFSDADREARHTRLADEAVWIGPAPAPDSYLRADRIIEAALGTGSLAIHPGYGFLSEQSTFGSAVEAAGLAFIGPTPETLAALGDKLSARRTALRLGVPIVPGTLEPLAIDVDRVSAIDLSELADVGFPVLIKAAAGGGGRGMRRVDAIEDVPAAAIAAAHEAGQAFGVAAIYVERLIEGARHIEVQLLGDGHGDVVALGERDCSVQRRHQKLVEEAPAPGLTQRQRRELLDLAVRLGRAVGLRGAATAEFLMAPDGSVHFLEVNARLQVEHGVTELVTGLDLVREQLLIAAGQPLSPEVRRAAEVADRSGRHAIELRISAEDPGQGFLPVPGRLSRWREPSGTGVRVDSGVEAGWLVPPDYDALLAKILVVASDRDGALARAREALAGLDCGGVQTTAPFLAWLLDHAAFREARLRTDLVDRDWSPAGPRTAAAMRAVHAVARHVWLTGLAPPDGQASTAPGWPPDDVRQPDAHGPHATAAWRSAGRRAAVERWP